jgi:citrate lyase subunit beta / citryl-CoA lyase
MRLRSMLFVPADSERKLEKARASAADALILDLEDSVAPPAKSQARDRAAAWIDAQALSLRSALFVRINPLDSGLALDDLAAVVRPGLAGIMQPKTRSVGDIERLAHYLDALEVRAGIEPGTIRIVPVATETPSALLTMQGYVQPVARLAALTWGAEDLSAAVGAVSNRDEDGRWSPLYEWAGAMCLCAAASAGVPALDTLYADFRDRVGLEASCRQARRRGYGGRIAIHPDQVDIINAAFTPSEAEQAHARRIVDAFAAQPAVGALSLDGVMIDIPHLKQARRTLGLDT